MTMMFIYSTKYCQDIYLLKLIFSFEKGIPT